ncbi:hypothetical protein RND71_043266 [Anisodus tanguticus]|uniref:Eukaryotic translation initiation factor eIF1 n=1 Tax=Anisodus tanguticus TaxID=243964 RepID=A0AAE1UME2_9SOLA|nr:hypothetical protein RND71_043266 [Anisodus tanguticus]
MAVNYGCKSYPFADAINAADEGIQDNLIHIRIQQRNGRKTLTTVQGISDSFDKKRIVKACKKEFACNGTIVEHPEYGEVIQFQGDQRNNICQFLTKIGIAKQDQLKIHDLDKHSSNLRSKFSNSKKRSE